MLCDGFCMCSNFFCTLLHIACQRAYVICDAVIYSKRLLLSLRPLPSNNELSAVKAHCQSTLCLFVLLCRITLLSTVSSNHLEQINDDDDDDDDDCKLYTLASQWHIQPFLEQGRRKNGQTAANGSPPNLKK